jgi:hypothetical protein
LYLKYLIANLPCAVCTTIFYRNENDMGPLGRWVWRTAFFALFLGVFSGTFQRVEAQVVGGTISGSVKDPSGAAVSGAEVTITDAATGILHAATTDSSGFYSVPNLLPGKYNARGREIFCDP